MRDHAAHRRSAYASSHAPSAPRGRASLERFKRLIALAQARGEPVEPLVKRLVVETIEQVQEGLAARQRS